GCRARVPSGARRSSRGSGSRRAAAPSRPRWAGSRCPDAGALPAAAAAPACSSTAARQCRSELKETRPTVALLGAMIQSLVGRLDPGVELGAVEEQPLPAALLAAGDRPGRGQLVQPITAEAEIGAGSGDVE